MLNLKTNFKFVANILFFLQPFKIHFVIKIGTKKHWEQKQTYTKS
jgi:hypothetical protein